MYYFVSILGELPESYHSIYLKLTEAWILSELGHRMSLTASNEFWKIATEFFPRLIEAKQRESITKKIPQFRTIRESLYKSHVPPIRLEFAYEVKETGDIIILSDLESTPASRFPPSNFTKLYESAKIEVNSENDIRYMLMLTFAQIAMQACTDLVL